MRFDDSLKTVLSADMESGVGARSAWRQLVDLIGRGRVAADGPAIARLRLLRQAVPLDVRAASARALAFTTPPAGLVGLFAEDTIAVAAPVIRTAVLPAEQWIALLPRLDMRTRALLRHRRDLPPEVVRGLESFGPADFVLDHQASEATAPAVIAANDTASGVVTPEVAASQVEAHEASVATAEAHPSAADPAPADGAQQDDPAPNPSPCAATPDQLPAVAAWLAPIGNPGDGDDAEHPAAAPRLSVPPATIPELRPAPQGGFQIADLVARIDAFQRQRPDPAAPAERPRGATRFRFETDAEGIIRSVEGVARGALVGASLAHGAPQGEVRVDAVINGALRQRQRFAGARLDVGGLSDAAGAWRVSGEPLFDAASGRFTGYAATARRPRVDEDAARAARRAASDSLRQLVHELRTPTNAIAGFAELIEAQLLGPVTPVYRDHALTIRQSAADLLAAIDDLDTAARIEGQALDLRPTAVHLQPLLERIVADLAPLAALRGTVLDIHPMADDAALTDDRAAERLLSRLLAALTSAAAPGERIDIAEAPAPAGQVGLCFARPQALAVGGEEALLSIDADAAGEGEGAPLLGTGFALRLARNLAAELGGELVFGSDLLTLRLPAALNDVVAQATH